MSPEDFFAGKTALITGAASGIGRALSLRLAELGARPLITDRDLAGAEALVAEIVASDRDAVARQLDVTDAEACAKVAAELWEERPVDLLFANAGVGNLGLVRDLEPEHWKRCVDVNLWGVLHCVWALYPRMIARGEGGIVLTASLSGLVPVPGLAAYTMCKHAVVGFGGCLRSEAAVHGVQVNVVCPGFVATNVLAGTECVGLPRETGAQIVAESGGAIPVEEAVAEILAGIAANREQIVFPEAARQALAVRQARPERYQQAQIARAQAFEALRER